MNEENECPISTGKKYIAKGENGCSLRIYVTAKKVTWLEDKETGKPYCSFSGEKICENCINKKMYEKLLGTIRNTNQRELSESVDLLNLVLS